MKTVKCYSPCAEITISYSDGTNTLVQLIPPFNISTFNQDICPEAMTIPFGTFAAYQTLAKEIAYPHLAVNDLVLDNTKNLSAIEIKSTASETMLGLIGVTIGGVEDMF